MNIENLTVRLKCEFCKDPAIAVCMYKYDDREIFLCPEHLLQYDNIMESKVSYFNIDMHENAMKTMYKTSKASMRGDKREEVLK